MEIDLSNMVRTYEILKNAGPANAGEIARAITLLNDKDIPPSGMIERLQSLKYKISDLQAREKLLSREILDLGTALKRAEETLQDRQNSIALKDRTLNDLKKQESDFSDQFWKAAEGMDLDPMKLPAIARKASSLSYDADIIIDMHDLEDYGLDHGIRAGDLRTLILNLKNLESMGWRAKQIGRLSMALESIGNEPDDIIWHLEIYREKFVVTNRSIDDLNERLQTATIEHQDKMDGMARDEERLDRKIEKLQKRISATKTDIDRINAEKKSLKDGKVKLDAAVKEIVSQFGETYDLGEHIKRLLGTRKSLENEISRMESRADHLTLSISFAENLPRVIVGRDMKVRDLCISLMRFVSGELVSDLREVEIRDTVINQLIEISKGGVEPVRYTNHKQYIPGSLYEDLIRIREERTNILREKEDLTRIRQMYESEIRAFLEDYLALKFRRDRRHSGI